MVVIVCFLYQNASAIKSFRPVKLKKVMSLSSLRMRRVRIVKCKDSFF